MLINSPISRTEEALPLIQAGADLFYMGIDFTSLLGIRNIVSSRWPWRSGNFHREQDILEAVRIVHAHRKKIYLTLNEHSYLPSVLEKILTWLKKHAVFDGIIAADIAIILKLKDTLRTPIIASTGLNVFNHGDIDFFKKLGIKNMILPRTLNIKEIKDLICHKRSVKFEVIVYNHDCYFIDGLCRFLHGIHSKHGCKSMHTTGLPGPVRSRIPLFEDDHLQYLWDLNKIGVHSVKIVGRINPLAKKIKDVMLLRSLMKSMTAGRSRYIKTYAATERGYA